MAKTSKPTLRTTPEAGALRPAILSLLVRLESFEGDFEEFARATGSAEERRALDQASRAAKTFAKRLRAVMEHLP